jgi:hypothetical protein
MKTIATIAGAFAVTFLAGTVPGHAAPTPKWCADNNGTTRNCGFMTRMQCEEAASGNGGTCSLNPGYMDKHPRATWYSPRWSMPPA